GEGTATPFPRPPARSRRPAAGGDAGADAGKNTEELAARALPGACVPGGEVRVPVSRSQAGPGQHDRGLAVGEVPDLSRRVARLARAVLVDAADARLARAGRQAAAGDRGGAVAGDDRDPAARPGGVAGRPPAGL